MPDRTRLQKENSKGSHPYIKETSKSGIKDSAENKEQTSKGRFDDTAEMFRGLFTGDDHYHSRGSSDLRLWG